jgi:hypothetical protein
MVHSKTSELTNVLCRGRNADGGWGYYPGKVSRIEPTCWIALYLLRASDSEKDLTTDIVRWFAARQREDGFLDDATGLPPNVGFSALAAIVVGSAGLLPAEGARRLLGAVYPTKGVASERTRNRQDNTLRGWSWLEDTFSWVEPIAWSLLALKKSSALPQREQSARIEEAERMLFDRVCRTGGWNHGNSNMFGQELNADIPATALALLALQDRREHPSVQKSIEYLTRQRLAEPAGMALSLTSICLRVYGRSTADVDERLAALAETHSFFNNQHVAAMALYCLTAHDHDVEDFRL